ncbi:MAG TPA: hypothetical protein VID68_07320 [Solirubrobacteraceae bacterium]|jgi:hypothetical protein
MSGLTNPKHELKIQDAWQADDDWLDSELRLALELADEADEIERELERDYED